MYLVCLFLSLQGTSQLQINADASETLFLPEQPPPPLPPPPLLPPSLTNGAALTAAKPPPTLIKVLFWMIFVMDCSVKELKLVTLRKIWSWKYDMNVHEGGKAYVSLMSSSDTSCSIFNRFFCSFCKMGPECKTFQNN